MSLAGRGVLVTRPARMAGALAERIERAGGRALVFPMIEIQELARPDALERLGDFALAIFVSPTSVERALAAISKIPMKWPRTLPVAAVGEGTRRALEAAGFAEVIAPREGADSEALLALPELARFDGQRILVVRGAGGRELLASELARRGCRVESAECYRRVKPTADRRPLLEAWDAGQVSAATVFSREALDNLAGLVGEQRLRAIALFVSHERIAAHARGRGLQPVLAGPGDDAMLERLVAYFHERD